MDEEQPSLREKCHAAGIPVFTPQEYLDFRNIDVLDESRQFILALEQAVIEARMQGILHGKDILDFLVPAYRLLLLDEINEQYAHIARPV